jgi:hypothetical protein
MLKTIHYKCLNFEVLHTTAIDYHQTLISAYKDDPELAGSDGTIA